MTERSAATPILSPVGAGERIELIDILRGFALLGILVVNFWGDTGTAMPRVDAVSDWALDRLVSSSFYPLFSFLFGLGFAVQLMRARERGASVAGIYFRRLLGLFLIGSFHAIVIWDGDILVAYAIAGLLLIPLHRLRDRWLLPLAVLPLLLGLWAPQVRSFAGSLGAGSAESRELTETAQNHTTLIADNRNMRNELDATASRSEAWIASTDYRWSKYARAVRGTTPVNLLLNDIVAFFLIGLIVGRRRVLQDVRHHRRALAWTAAISLPLAAAGYVADEHLGFNGSPWGNLAWCAENYGMTAFYIAAIAFAITHWRRAAALMRPFAAAGQIGLSNYLLQSVVMTFLFTRYGFGFPEPEVTMWLLINIAFFFGIQVPLSSWWIKHYRFGPAEWVWRSMTYGRLQPMRPGAATPVVESVRVPAWKQG